MATTFQIKKDATGIVPVVVRVQQVSPKINLKLVSGIRVEASKWEKGKVDSSTRIVLEQVRQQLDAECPKGLTSERAKDIIRSIVYAEQLAEAARVEEEEIKRQEAEKRIEEERKRVTFMAYYRRFLDDIAAGKVVSSKNTKYSERSRINYKQGYNKLIKYQEERGVSIDWDDLDMDFFDDYRDFLRGEGYNINTTAKRFKEIKFIVHNAHDRGITNSTIFLNQHFNVGEVEVDSIYLTREEVDAIKAVDLSEKPAGYEIVRDLFLVGILTAQRISDYNDIRPENIRTIIEKRIVEDENGEDRIEKSERVFIDIRQKKTRQMVSIPANAELRAILAKYDNRLPHVCDQVLNRYIKEIAKEAGLTQLVSIRSTKGGKNSIEKVEKWKLVHSHTARRTGATWMFLSGMDSNDILRVTGHQSVKMLNKYIRTDALENAKKLADKYDYFA